MNGGQITVVAASAVAALVMSAGASQAATVRVCNKTTQPIGIALAFKDAASQFTTKGWWKAAPGECTGDLERGADASYYLHLVRTGVIAIPLKGQMVRLCVSPTRFEDQYGKHVKADKKLDCDAADLIERSFTRIDSETGSADVIEFRADGTISRTAGPKISQPPRQAQMAPRAPQQPATAQPQTAPGAPTRVTQTGTPDACKRFPNLC